MSYHKAVENFDAKMLILLRYRLFENYLTFEFQNKFIHDHMFQEVKF
jgi:hypothetical protein